MSKNLKYLKKPGITAAATAAILLSGCAAEPTYSPPERPSVAETCPIGEVWVCRDHYPTRLDRDGRQLHCMCEDLQGMR